MMNIIMDILIRVEVSTTLGEHGLRVLTYRINSFHPIGFSIAYVLNGFMSILIFDTHEGNVKSINSANVHSFFHFHDFIQYLELNSIIPVPFYIVLVLSF